MLLELDGVDDREDGVGIDDLQQGVRPIGPDRVGVRVVLRDVLRGLDIEGVLHEGPVVALGLLDALIGVEDIVGGQLVAEWAHDSLAQGDRDARPIRINFPLFGREGHEFAEVGDEDLTQGLGFEHQGRDCARAVDVNRAQRRVEGEVGPVGPVRPCRDKGLRRGFLPRRRTDAETGVRSPAATSKPPAALTWNSRRRDMLVAIAREDGVEEERRVCGMIYSLLN